MPTDTNTLARHTFLHGMPGHQLESLASIARTVAVSPGQYLGRERDVASDFYLIDSGRVSIEMSTRGRGPVSLQTIGRGDIVGWSWLTPPYRWQFDARAIERTTVLALDARCLRLKFEQDPELGFELMKRLIAVVSERLSATRREALESYV
jgi:CRP-like cAMP-binding protein